MGRADFKLPVALRSTFGGLVNGYLVVCGGFKSEFEELKISGNHPFTYLGTYLLSCYHISLLSLILLYT